MLQTAEAHYTNYFDLFPFLVRVPVPITNVAMTQEAMHSWASQAAQRQYAASPYRNFDDPSKPSGEFMWHFLSADAAKKFAAQFAGKLIEKR